MVGPPFPSLVHASSKPLAESSQLPLGLLNAAQGQPMLVELKNGETLNGHLVMCDNWMNLTLKEVVQTSPVRLLILCAKPIPTRNESNRASS